MTIFDTFMFRDELDVLEARLYELEAVPGLIHVAVEADVDHQDHPKPYVLSDNLDRFDQWKDRLRVVRATNLPTATDNPDPWSREHAQREATIIGLGDAISSDVVLHGDLDEIPRDLIVRNLRPRGFVTLEMTCFSMAVDWLHPDPWPGTVATTAGNIRTFAAMRDTRTRAWRLPDAGWHLGWLGGKDAQLRKLGSFCHPEIRDRTLDGIEQNLWLEQGFHVDGRKLIPVDVDGTWPRWVRDGLCPRSWFRDRSAVGSSWTPPTGRA